METGHVVRFASQKHAFLVEATPCLEGDDSRGIITLTFSEIVPAGTARRDCLTFTLRVCPRTWIEHDPPPRSLEVESLVREFLARFPTGRIQELEQASERARVMTHRLKSLTFSGSRSELVTYANVIDAQGGVREGVTEHSYFFVFEGREFLVEDHYCANPECDCRQVHLEFWERVHQWYPKRGIHIQQRLMATFQLSGELTEIRFSKESAATTRHLLRAWVRRCSAHFRECCRRYELIRTIGQRSFPPTSPLGAVAAASKDTRSGKRASVVDGKPSARRNDPCPCGSGLKYKRCCARRTAVAD